VAKAAAIFVIALVLVAAVLLTPAPVPAPIPGTTLAMHAVALPGVPVRTPFGVDSEPVQSAPRTRSESTPNRFRVDSEPVQSRFGVGSEYEYDSTQGSGADVFASTRTRTNVVAPLDARTLVAAADAAPAISADALSTERRGHLSRAFATAADQTSGAVRTARQALRSVF
jgi:hypothetical protein